MADTTAALKTSVSAAGVVSKNDGEYCGYVVTTITAVGSIVVYDNASAASGTIVDVIPAATAVGSNRNLASHIRMKNGIYVDFAGGATGTVTIFYN
jgi:hypothetical protein